MIYSEKGRVLFTHVSRTGGMAIDNCLRRKLADAKTIVGQHAPLVAARALLGERFEQAYKFAIVRNPWDRFVSWYALMVQTKSARELNRTALIDPAAPHWRGFDAFLEKWCAEEVQIAGVQRRALSQWAQLVDADGALLSNDIGRFETYAYDVSWLFANANLDARSIEKINASQHLHYSTYYSAFGRELIEQVFPEDVANFGYRFEEAGITPDSNAPTKPHLTPSFSHQKGE